jgi:hypothetical protein
VVTPELALAAWHECIAARRPAGDCTAALVAFAAAHDLDDRWFAIAHRPTWELALRDRRS